jgi:hypothetical protein
VGSGVTQFSSHTFILQSAALKPFSLQEGAGKLIVLPEWPEEIADDEKNKTCIKVYKVGGSRQAVEVIGTFRNGFLGKIF